MTAGELEEKLRKLCDESGLSNRELSDVVGTLADEYEILANGES